MSSKVFKFFYSFSNYFMILIKIWQNINLAKLIYLIKRNKCKVRKTFLFNKKSYFNN